MASNQEPYSFELIADRGFEGLVRSISERPGMYVVSDSDLFGAVLAYISGYNSGANDAPLFGFHQWLVVRANGGNNVQWPGTSRSALQSDTEPLSDEQLVRAFCDVVLVFLDHRRQRGLAAIFQDYNEWLLNQPWYDGPLRGPRQ